MYVYAAAAAGWAGLHFNEVQRASSTLVCVRIVCPFSMWCAAQWCLVQYSALLIVPGHQKNWNWSCALRHLSQWNRMTMDLVHLGWMFLFTMPGAVVLSVYIGVCGCLWPISSSICHWGTASHALMYRDPSLASAAEDITALMSCARLRMDPLLIGSSRLDDMKKFPPAHLGRKQHCVQQVPCHFLVGYDGILMCSCVVEELLTARHGILCKFGLGGCDCAKCYAHSGIYSMFVVEEKTYHFLDEFFLAGERHFDVCVLYCGSICRDCMLVWLVFEHLWNGVWIVQVQGHFLHSLAWTGVPPCSCSPNPWWFPAGNPNPLSPCSVPLVSWWGAWHALFQCSLHQNHPWLKWSWWGAIHASSMCEFALGVSGCKKAFF